jgi:hypothetical protein
MRLTLSTALALALLANLLPGCDRVATDREEAASKGGTAPAGTTPGQSGEAPAQERKY